MKMCDMRRLFSLLGMPHVPELFVAEGTSHVSFLAHIALSLTQRFGGLYGTQLYIDPVIESAGDTCCW